MWISLDAMAGRSAGAYERLPKPLRHIPGLAARLQGVKEAEWRKRPSIGISPLLAAPGVADTVVTAIEELLDAQPLNQRTEQ